MTTHSDRFLFWAPRALSMLLTAFISLFALDVFEEAHGFRQILTGLTVHLIPSFVLIVALVAAWRREWLGTAAFTVFGIFLMGAVRGPWWVKTIFFLPCFIIAGLFLANWRDRTGRFPARPGWLLGALLGLGLFHADAAANSAEIRWNELAALIVGHTVSIPLAGGAVVRGEALSVREGSLLIDIKKSAGPPSYPVGQTAIPRGSITEVRLTEHSGSGGRILGSVVGALLGSVAGAEIAVHGAHSEAAGVSAFTAAAVAGTVAGYFAGRAVDRHSRLLRIAPEPAGPDR